MSRFLLLLCTLVILVGCSTSIPSSKGGDISITTIKQIDSTDDKGKPVKTTTTTKVDVAQPANPLTPATTTVTTDPKTGTPIIETNTGAAQKTSDIAKVIANAKLLDPLIWIGGVIMALSILFIFTGAYLVAVACFLVGGGIVACAFFLAQYGLYILIIGGAVVLAAIAYGAYRYIVAHRSGAENTSLIALMRKYLPAEADEKIFTGKNPLAHTVQSPSTVKFVRKVKGTDNL